MIDRAGVFASGRTTFGKVELGCGATKRDPDAIGIDVLDHPGVDLIGDAAECLGAFPPASVRQVSSSHFLEHVNDLEEMLRAIDRVLAPGGDVLVTVPHFSNPYYYSDPTHVRPFGLYTFSYLCHQGLFRRGVPQYGAPLPWTVESVRLGFTAEAPFPVVGFARRRLGGLINRSYRLMEHYENLFCWVFPCYEIEFRLRKTGTGTSS